MGLFNIKHNKSLNDETYNVIQSISKAKTLYKNLIIQAHPDKHSENIDLATELTELVNINKFNYRELLDLEKRIKNELTNNHTIGT